ncbi:HAMP domain-containing sensor histidine kinase [Alteromonadaceae bacterium BrNp21-10]|nr:HAMP domain-containing sensor histidine kinase [Alteromonadaceae bacterium BrNp21-10]
MKFSLYQRLAVSLVVVFILLLSAFIWGSDHLHTNTKLQAEQQLHLGLAEHLVQDNPLLQEGGYDHDALENLFHTLMILGPSFEFYYVDTNGHILAYSAEPGKVKRDRIDLQPILALINQSKELPILGDDPRDQQRQKIFSAAPVYQGEVIQGYLYMIIGGEVYDSILAGIQNNQFAKNLALFGIAAMVFLLIALLVMFRFFTSPLRRLMADVEKVKAAGFDIDVSDLADWQSKGNNEVQLLGSAFQQMLLHIQGQYSQLQQLDSQRRVLLADLSHDLRTPLANLHGYIETLAINADTLDDDERRRFIDISLKNAGNLKRLIDQIFELAYLEGGQVTLNQEPFPLGELLHDVVAKFALKAQSKDITMAINPSQFDYQVFADIGKLERVLTNLIENAIRHTPQGGTIQIGVSSAADNKIRIDLRDTGVGISEKEIAFIFDARYQATNTKDDKTLHAGLGLAISRKLMALLDSDLQVQSELGRGTCFSFELKQV